MKVAMCIVGQISRLETESKVRFIREFPEVDVFVVMQKANRYSRALPKEGKECMHVNISHSEVDLLNPVHTTWISESNLILPKMLEQRIDRKKYKL